MLRLPRFAALCAIAMMAAACSDVPTGSDPTVTALGRIGLAPAFTPAATQAFQQLSAFGIEVTSVHVRLVAPDGSTRDTSIAFPVGMSELEVELAVPLRTAGQTFRADLELLNSDGVVLFSGSLQVVAQAANGIGSGAPATIQINYTGPGASAKTLTVSPPAGVLAGASSLSLTAGALDANGGQVSDLLVRWTTSDATLATVTSTGNATATVTSTGKRGAVTISAITPLGLTGSAVLTVVPVASRVVVISGDGQTGVAGSALALPLVVEVQAADNLPVPGAPVTFRAITAGGVVATTSATTDASGRVSSAITLGQAAGVYQFEAVSGTLAPAGISVTATSAPAAMLSIISGNFQAGTIGTTLPQALVVKVVNKFGLPVAGATVKWATASGGGSPVNATTTTAADGTSSNSYTLGTVVQTEDLRASLPSVPPPAGEVSFALGAIALPPDALSGTGSGQHATVGADLPNPFIVNVTDRFGNPVSGAKVSWSVAPNSTASASFTPTVSTTDVNGNASTVVTLGSVAGGLTVTATVNNLTLNFSATADAGSPPTGPGTLSGFVFDAVSGGPISGATATIVSGTTTVATVTTNSAGNFTTAQLPAGTYSATITASGYTTVVISVLTVNGNTQAPAAPLVPQSTQQGSIAGVVFDATNNNAVSVAVTLELRAGVNSTSGTPLQTVTSSQASYTFSNVAAGTYTIVAKASGYADATKTGISVGGSTTSNQNIFISPIGVAGNVRIVLTWRSTPRDLDSYLTGPDGNGGRFLVAYYSAGDCTAAPFACLDNDVTGGNGPETVTIAQQLPGIYRYSVNNYSGFPNLDVSGARVDVYINNALAQSFSVPSGSGENWTVFELNGTTITPINTIGNGAITSRIPIGSGVSASRIPTSGARPSASRDDTARIRAGKTTHPKRSGAPR
ncbi:MAG: carboxypeptidase regulatory-like domain-containing protein [bacterium]